MREQTPPITLVAAEPEEGRKRPKFKHSFPHKGLLPKGRYYTLTWGIPDEFGGMTTVVLERSSAFARQDNRRIEILTLSADMQTRNRDEELHEAERIDSRVRVRNIWKDLTSWPDRKLRRMGCNRLGTSAAIDDALARTSNDWSHCRRADDGTVLQVDRYRNNGRLLVIDRKDMRNRGTLGGRQITLFDRHQKVIGQWSTARAFYHAWLDVVLGGKRSYLICDSAFAGGLIHNYRRDNVILCQVIHSHHLSNPRTSSDVLVPGKFEVLSNLDSFDVVTTLTDQQRLEMNEASLSAGKLRSVSNLTADLGGSPHVGRDNRQGTQIAHLVSSKRVDDAVVAIAQAANREPDIQLDIYGDGTAKQNLSELVDQLGVTNNVHFRGHRTGAKRSFLTSSFSLLTSRAEGQGLVLLESMSAGCIPIAYDIAYGPANIIDNGVNGILVPDGNVDALSAAILRVVTMSENDLLAMRQAAIRRAAEYYEEPIVQRWGEVLAEHSFTPIARNRKFDASLSSATVSDDYIHLAVNIDASSGPLPDQLFLAWKGRKGSLFGRAPALRSGQVVQAHIPTSRLATAPPGLIDVYLDLREGRNFSRARIACDNSAIVNGSDSVNLYTTAHGNLTARIQAPDNTLLTP
ncbi:glycosyltransferase [Brevibacterium linens]|uniref:glycosyltransferase n=1 Tax=Brevibacterium linens TaxID=1703 RepID=UPI003BF540A1